MSGPVDFGALYDAFNARDADALLARFDTDVIWPNGWEGGTLHGRDAVRAYWLRQWAEIDPVVTPMGQTIEGDGRIAVDVLQVVRSLDGRELSRARVTHVYRVENGLIRSMAIRGAPV